MPTVPTVRLAEKADAPHLPDLPDLPDLPHEVRIALAEVMTDAREGLLALGAATGLRVMHAMFEAEVAAKVGPHGRHDPERSAVRHGSEAGSVTLVWAVAGSRSAGREPAAPTGPRCPWTPTPTSPPTTR